MSDALTKTYLAITGILFAVTTPINADEPNNEANHSTSTTPHCKPTQPPAKSPCCGPTCRPSQYYSTNCISTPNCQEIKLTGELLYWTAELGGLESAFGTTSITTSVAGGITTTTVKEKDTHPDWKWRPGFRIGLEYGFGCFTLDTDWTHYHGSAHFNKHGQHGHWKIDYDTIDLLFGRRFSIAPCFYFRPFIGVRGLLVHQSLKSHLETTFQALIGNSIVDTVKKDKEKAWGVGPELGVEANWYMGCNFSLYGTFDVVSYYGRSRTKIHNTDTFTSTVSVSNGKIIRNFNVIGTDGSIGLRYDKAWPVASEVLLTIKIGVEQHRIYDFSELGTDGTLSLDGANLAASIGYRY